MSELPAGLTQKNVEQYASIDARIKKLTAAKDKLNAVIKEKHVEAGRGKGTYVYGNVVVKIGETSSTNYKAIAEEMPFSVNPEIYKDPTVDPAKVPAKTKERFTTKKPTLSVEVTQ
jgi:hypothetical protein